MAHKPLVTVLMPAFEASEYITEAIKSILKQSFKRFELVIIDDCSKDKTYEIAKEYSRKDKRIRVYRNKKNLKIAETLNKGIRLARSEYIARMDADDVSSADRLKLQYSLLSKMRNTAIVGANMKIMDDTGMIVSKRDYPTTSKKLKKVIFKYSPFAHPVVMYRKSAVLEFGGYDERMVPCEDIDLWFKLGSKYNFASINKYLLYYRVLPSYSSKYDLRYIEKLGFKIKWQGIKNLGYRPNFYDIIYNLAQYLTLGVMPVKIRIQFYDLLRSRKFI